MIKRYRLIGDKMVERPNKGEWVRWEDVERLIKYNKTLIDEKEKDFPRGDDDATDSDNKRNRK